MTELSPKYSAKEIESKWYSLWEKSGYFRPKSDSRPGTRDLTYVVVIPPPNVTGILHMGHALNNTIQDVLVRWVRMKGLDTLWVPGVDHAGIATQNVVEKKLAKEKTSRHQLGREKFLEQVWKWKEEHGSTITRQLRRLGASCDWSRERFTMDEGLSKAVREAFVTLYERGLIYQGNYIINWCPRCQTALSDEEAEHKETEGAFYHIRYPIFRHAGKLGDKDTIHPAPDEFIVVATTRPETMLGDTAVAVHPNDERYKHLHGKTLLLPLMNREIPVITDELVDPEFGTGMVKVTPAHDPNDFEMGRRHNLPEINVMRPDGKMNENAGAYAGLDRFEARKKVVADLEAQELFVKKEKHVHAVGRCYRCDTVVEPYLSKQWFVKMKPLAEKALKAHREGKTVFYPDRWTKVYTNWLEGIRDWCISRQIWWGHQIPVWYCDQCRESRVPSREDSRPETRDSGPGVIVSRETPSKCPHCGSTELKQDPDVLDTWFSSWLWPFSTLGWPQKTEDLKRFYPTSDLITAAEIIFFWVARMIMAGLEFMGEVPFSRIHIHGTVRAADGRKMSKSLGNSIDPLEVIGEMGADALRFSMIMLSSQDVYLSREKFEVGRNFTNKIWNASRYVMMNLEGASHLKSIGHGPWTMSSLSLPNRWILSRLFHVAETADKYLKGFGLAQASSEIYHFVWNDFCDWFIELSKPVFEKGTAEEKKQTQQVLFFVLERSLKLLHPFMPFVTEEIWSKLKETAQDQKGWPASISLSEWPYAGEREFKDKEAEAKVGWLQDYVTAIREHRTHLNIPTSEKLEAYALTKDFEVSSVMNSYKVQMMTMARLKSFTADIELEPKENLIGKSFSNFTAAIVWKIDVGKERQRLQKELDEKTKWIEILQKKLANENFVKNAPAEIIEKEQTKIAEANKIIQALQDNLKALR